MRFLWIFSQMNRNIKEFKVKSELLLIFYSTDISQFKYIYIQKNSFYSHKGLTYCRKQFISPILVNFKFNTILAMRLTIGFCHFIANKLNVSEFESIRVWKTTKYITWIFCSHSATLHSLILHSNKEDLQWHRHYIFGSDLHLCLTLAVYDLMCLTFSQPILFPPFKDLVNIINVDW